MFDALGDAVEWIIKAPFILCGWLIVGFIAGALARYIMRVEDKHFISDIGLGLLGAIIGGLLTSWFGINTQGDTGATEWLITLAVATVGAMFLIFVGRILRGSGSKKRRR